MKNQAVKEFKLTNFDSLYKGRVKTSPSPQSSSLVSQQKNDETVLPFHYTEYSFLNLPQSSVNTLRTTVNFKLSPETLQKLVSVNHPNIIAIRKIIKSSPRTAQLNTPNAHYSLFYESVQYNIKFFVQHSQTHHKLHSLLLTFDMQTILYSVFNYLQEEGISYAVRFNDIGITADGQIKVYIPPNAIVDPKKNINIAKALEQVLDWWDKCMQLIKDKPFKKEKRGMQPNRFNGLRDVGLRDTEGNGNVDEGELEKELGDLLGDEEEEEEEVDEEEDEEEEEDEDEEEEEERQQPKATAAAISQLKNSTQSLSRIGSFQLQKMKKIDEQVKNFRQKLTQKDNNQLRQKNMKITKKMSQLRLDHLIPSPKMIDSHIPQSPSQLKYYHQPIQQNINCINIYNHNNLAPPSRYTAMPNYYPQQFQQFLPRNTYGDNKNLEEEIYENDDQISQDTYDIQFENQFDGHVNPKLRKSVFSPSERGASEHPKGESQKLEDQFRAKENVNVVCNKNYTESAGPLQFKSFLNKYMKPQMKPTQEKQHHEESQEPSLSNFNTQSIRSLSVGLKKQQFKASKIESSYDAEQAANIRRNKSQNQFLTSHRMPTGDREIEVKVRKALQKTKNAIALLSKVKQNRANSKNTSFK